ncbi:MAG: hypothetical protein WCL16_00475 [bacterium]
MRSARPYFRFSDHRAPASVANLLLLLAICLLPFMPTDESLWIDEICTVGYAAQPTITAWFGHLRNDALVVHSSDAQMPLGMFLTWLCVRVLGESEWALRAPNLVYAALAMVALARIGRLIRLGRLPLLFAIQPFVWFYVNEARPYALLMAAGAWLLYGFLAGLHQRGTGAAWAWALSVGGFVLAASTITGVILFAVASVVLACGLGRLRVLPSRAACCVVGGAWLLLTPLGAFYLWGMLQGIAKVRLWSAGISNLIFAAYEFAGYSGLGIPRNTMRAVLAGHDMAQLRGLLMVYLPAMSMLTLVYGTLIFGMHTAWRASNPRQRTVIRASSIWLGTSVALVWIASLAINVPIWGRHLAALMPAWVVAIGWLTAGVQQARPRWGTVVLVFLALLLLCSTAIQRLDPKYGHDDYRSATSHALAVARNGQTVWWVADNNTGVYYGINHPGIRMFSNPESIHKLPTELPGLALISKPDIYDAHGVVRKRLLSAGYQRSYCAVAFEQWTPPALHRVDLSPAPAIIKP